MKTFILGSGRSGTAYMARQHGLPHEHEVHTVQPLAVKRYHGLISPHEAKSVVAEVYAKVAGDSSNKISWLIPELYATHPDAQFIHLIRDGRKVASSYFHKLGDECYGPDDVAVFRAYLKGGKEPLPLKRYWWPLPQNGFDQFQLICWHWAEINRVILAALGNIPLSQRRTVRVEDFAARPFNVNRPVDYPLTTEQSAQFWTIAGHMMESLGYADAPEYRVNYG